MFKRGIGALFLLAQSLVVLFWVYLGCIGLKAVISGPKEGVHPFGVGLVLSLLLLIWGLAAGIAYCMYRQVKDPRRGSGANAMAAGQCRPYQEPPSPSLSRLLLYPRD
jgi:hypothetical protein